MEGNVQPALTHPPTRAALNLGRDRARRLVVLAVAGALFVIVTFAVVGVPEGDEESSGTSVLVLHVLALGAAVATLLLGLDGGLRLRRARYIDRVLLAGPWHVVGPYRSVSKPFGPPGTGRYETLIAVARPTPDGVIRGRLVGLRPGWRFALSGEGPQLWLAGPVAGRYVVGSTDGVGLALVKEPEGLRKVELGKHLAALGPH